MRIFIVLYSISCSVNLVQPEYDLEDSGEECGVYAVRSGGRVTYRLTGSDFNIGYLRLNSNEPPRDTQIFIYSETEESPLQIFINNNSNLVLRIGGKMIAETGHPLPPNPVTPSWYFLLVKMAKNELSVSRPERLTALLRATTGVPSLAFKKLQIASKHTEYVTFNCFTGCPRFTGDDFNNVSVNLSIPFFINIRSNNPRNVGLFSIGVSASWLQDFNRTYRFDSSKPRDLKIYADKDSDGEGSTSIILEFNASYDTFKLLGNTSHKNFIFTVFSSKNVTWSYDCWLDQKATDNNETSSTTTYVSSSEGGTDGLGRHNVSGNFSSQKERYFFSVGEVAAWIVASLALCGLIVVGVTLYSRITNNSWMLGIPENAISMSHVADIEMANLPKEMNNSIFYERLRKPEEGSELEVREVNISMDKLYPLKFESEDNRSQRENDDNCVNLSSYKSQETTFTTADHSSYNSLSLKSEGTKISKNKLA